MVFTTGDFLSLLRRTADDNWFDPVPFDHCASQHTKVLAEQKLPHSSPISPSPDENPNANHRYHSPLPHATPLPLPSSSSLRILSLNVWALPISPRCRERIDYLGHILSLRTPSHTPSPSQSSPSSSVPLYDIICLQEVFHVRESSRLMELGALHGYPFHHQFTSGIGFPCWRGTIGPGLLLLSRYPLIDCHFHRFKVNGKIHKLEHSDYCGGKGVGLVRVKIGRNPNDTQKDYDNNPNHNENNENDLHDNEDDISEDEADDNDQDVICDIFLTHFHANYSNWNHDYRQLLYDYNHYAEEDKEKEKETGIRRIPSSLSVSAKSSPIPSPSLGKRLLIPQSSCSSSASPSPSHSSTSSSTSSSSLSTSSSFLSLNRCLFSFSSIPSLSPLLSLSPFSSSPDEYLSHRVLHAYETAKFIAAHRHPSHLTILCGDLNAVERDIVIEMLIHYSGLRDSYREIHPNCKGITHAGRDNTFFVGEERKGIIKIEMERRKKKDKEKEKSHVVEDIHCDCDKMDSEDKGNTKKAVMDDGKEPPQRIDYILYRLPSASPPSPFSSSSSSSSSPSFSLSSLSSSPPSSPWHSSSPSRSSIPIITLVDCSVVKDYFLIDDIPYSISDHFGVKTTFNIQWDGKDSSSSSSSVSSSHPYPSPSSPQNPHDVRASDDQSPSPCPSPFLSILFLSFNLLQYGLDDAITRRHAHYRLFLIFIFLFFLSHFLLRDSHYFLLSLIPSVFLTLCIGEFLISQYAMKDELTAMTQTATEIQYEIGNYEARRRGKGKGKGTGNGKGRGMGIGRRNNEEERVDGDILRKKME